ncbi:MAG: flavin reductase family protein [Canidatus Methanoxibalbensis ujae]|nr:flavin reductase family protein [Candidatus Methanoxibalbensis ujae]
MRYEMEIEANMFPKFLVRPVVVITTVSERGIPNAAPFSFSSPISFDPPLFGFSCSPEHDTWRNIKANGEFVANVVGRDMGEKMHILEHDFPYEENELKHASLTEVAAKTVRPPRIKEAKAWIECKMEKSTELGDHVWIVGRVLHAEVRDELWDGVLNVERAEILAHISGEFFAEGMRIVKYKRAR